MKLRIAAFLIAGAAALGLAAVPAAAHAMGRYRHGDSADALPQHLLRMADKLGLTGAAAPSTSGS